MNKRYRTYIPTIRSGILWDYVLVYLLLLLSAGFFFRHQYNRYTQPIFICLLLLTIVKKNKKFKCDVLIPTLMLITLIIFTAILTGFGYYEKYAYFIISIIISYLITQVFSYKRFFKLFSNCLYCICIASIIGWFLVEFVPSFVMVLPKLENTVGFDACFVGLTMLPVPNYVGFENRAQGIFWEPGAFQTMIVIAMLGDLFVNENSNKSRRYMIYLTALALTMSTTGYICLLVLVTILAVKDKKHILIYGMALILLGTVGIIALVSFKDRLPSFLYFTIFTKLETMLDYTPGVTISNVPAEKTVYVRMNSIYYPFIEYLKSPLWGIGFSGYDRIGKMLGYGNMFTFTPINFFAYFGFFYAYISMKGFMKTIKWFETTAFCKLLIILLVLISVSSEDYCGSVASITVFLLYGYSRNTESIEDIEGIRKTYEGCIY